jgi:hypothetical protein
MGSAEIAPARLTWDSRTAEQQLVRALHWVNLVSGRFFADHANRFQADGRLDQALLANLKDIRRELHGDGLPYNITHDLLGRVIFIQFLFQRTDSSGNAALNASVLRRLAEEGVLTQQHDSLASILSNYDDSYRFFRWLNERFNGDLFPGKAESVVQREQEWQQEIGQVRPSHLQLLSEFVRGQVHMQSGQRSLFPLYSFDTIPLEFISSIYEEFVSGGEMPSPGPHYTPGHIVDLILDGVLPWDDKNWNVKLLDPACGSGIFIVKAFQRLIHRWKLAHPKETPSAADLKHILENNLFGIDINPDAVRVASFSLYLAMCDEIDPRHYWTQVRFPRLRDRNLHAGDYFALDQQRPDIAVKRFDFIVGNAPWGQGTATKEARDWASKQQWSVPYGTIGPLFLARSVEALAPNGTISMLQPASMLTNSVGTAQKLRRRLFSDHKIEEVVNLSALRFGLFANAVDPACIITLRGTPPDGEYLSYICPKPSRSSLDDYRTSIDPQDVNSIAPSEAANRSDVWSILMWGNRRDLSLIRRLEAYPTLEKLETEGVIKTREGIIRGDRKKKLSAIVGRRILEGKRAGRLRFELNPHELPINNDDEVDSRASTDLSAFNLPQLIVKQGWTKTEGRFEAAVVRGSPGQPGVLCSQSYFSASGSDERLLEMASSIYNSKAAVYHLLLTSGRFSSYRPEPTMRDFLSVPIPSPRTAERLPRLTPTSVDDAARRLLRLTESDWALIDDALAYTLQDFKGDAGSPGRLPTVRGDGEDDLDEYCKGLVGVLRSAFGADKNVTCTVFTESGHDVLPIRLVMVHLDGPDPGGRIAHRRITSSGLFDELANVARLVSPDSSNGSQILRTRVARLYVTLPANGAAVPTVVVVKPDQKRYWTRSAGLRDGDEITADVLTWSGHPTVEDKSRVQ